MGGLFPGEASSSQWLAAVGTSLSYASPRVHPKSTSFRNCFLSLLFAALLLFLLFLLVISFWQTRSHVPPEGPLYSSLGSPENRPAHCHGCVSRRYLLACTGLGRSSPPFPRCGGHLEERGSEKPVTLVADRVPPKVTRVVLAEA